MDKENKNIHPKVTTRDVFIEYWKYAKTYVYYIIIIVLSLSIGTALMSVYIPTLYKKFFDMLQGTVDIGSISPSLLHLVLLIFGYNLVGWILYRFGMVFLTRLESFTMRDIRQGAYDYILQHSLNFFWNNFAGSLVQKINRFTRAFERIIDRLLIDVIPLTIKVVGISIVMISIDHRIALALAIWIVFFLLLSFSINKIKLKYDIEAAKVDSRISAVLSDSISNHNSVQLFTRSSFESEIFNEVNEKFSRIFSTRLDLGELINAIQIFLAMLVEFAIFYYGIKYWQVGMYSIGIFTILQAYIITLNSSFWNFNRIVRDLYEATADAREMVEILHLPHEIQDIQNANILNAMEPSSWWFYR